MAFSSNGICWIIKKILSFSTDDNSGDALMLFLKYLDANSSQSEEERLASNMDPIESYAYFRVIHMQGSTLYDFLVGKLEEDMQIKNLGPLTPSMETLHKNFYRENLNLNDFLEKDYLIFSLCYQLYQKEHLSLTLDHSPIKNFVSLIGLRYYSDSIWSIGSLITISCRRAIDIGLNRWEYYVGEPENKAEFSRNLWLQCYWWDKWYALMTGKQPLVYVEICFCLAPKDLMDVGIDYSMSVPSILTAINPEESKLDIWSLAISRITENVFKNILYNDDFVGLSAKGDRMDSLLKHICDTKEQLSNLCKKWIYLKSLQKMKVF